MYQFEINTKRPIRKQEPASTKPKGFGPFNRPVELSTKQLFHFRVRAKKGGHPLKNYYVQVPLNQGSHENKALAVVMRLFQPFYTHIEIKEIDQKEYLKHSEDE